MLHLGAQGSVRLVPPVPLARLLVPALSAVCFSIFPNFSWFCCEILHFPLLLMRKGRTDADAHNAGDPHTFVSTENAGGGEIDPHTSLSACLGVAEMSWQVPPTWQQLLPWRARPAMMVD